MSQSKYWMVTVNNPTVCPEEVIVFCNTNYIQHTFQYERGENRTLHIQMFCIFPTRKRSTNVQTLLSPFGRPHIELARDPHAGEEYCRKTDSRESGPWTNIVPNSIPKRGQRTDLAQVVSAIKEGKPINQVAHDFPEQYVKYGRGLRELGGSQTTQFVI